MDSKINALYHNKIIARILHTLVYELKEELKDCSSVLDLGCGNCSPIQHCQNIQHSVGVEAFGPYLEESRKQKIHSEYLQKEINSLDFAKNSFDAVIMIEVLEHLPKEMGKNILKKAEKWAKKKIILSTPNGYFPMDEVDGNSFQRHLSGWDAKELRQMGFNVRGMSGSKFFYHKKNTVHSLHQEGAIFSNIRFKPRKLFYVLNGLFQSISYYLPRQAFGLLAVKNIKSKK